MVTSEQVKELREKTGVSVMECKAALTEADGDMMKALEILSLRAVAAASKKAGRALGAGVVASYVHTTGQVGAMVLLSSETDFVSKNEEFTALARDIAMHAAAMQPKDIAELLGQQYIKDPSKTIAEMVSGAVQKFGERIEVSQLAFFSVK